MAITVREFVSSKLVRYGIELTSTEIDALLIDAGVSGDPDYSAETAQFAKLAIVKAIPELLMQADVTEGGFSVKWDKAGIRAYYALLCSELGIPSQLADSPLITDKSYLW